MKNDYFESQVELYRQWIEGKVRLEAYNTYANKWFTIPKYDGNITNLLPQVRVKETIKVPKTVYITTYDDGKMFAHTTEKEAILSVDELFSNSEYVIKLFELVETDQ